VPLFRPARGVPEVARDVDVPEVLDAEPRDRPLVVPVDCDGFSVVPFIEEDDEEPKLREVD
jgi:hypothetical protein